MELMKCHRWGSLGMRCGKNGRYLFLNLAVERVLCGLSIREKVLAKSLCLPSIICDLGVIYKKICSMWGLIGSQYALKLVPHILFRGALMEISPTFLFGCGHRLAQIPATCIDCGFVRSKMGGLPAMTCSSQLCFELTQLWGPPTVGTVASSVAQRNMASYCVLESSV